ncbi:MAG: hypothetical protein ACRET3_15580, partial [Burkholderiales bacterium]
MLALVSDGQRGATVGTTDIDREVMAVSPVTEEFGRPVGTILLSLRLLLSETMSTPRRPHESPAS